MVASPRLRELLKATAKRLNRKAEDSEPYLAILEENWYDSVDSLKLVQVAELQALGIPQRFAKELLQLAQTDGQKPEPPPPPSITVPSPHPPEGPPPRKRPHEDGPEYGKGQGSHASAWKSPRPEEKGSEERKGKGKGKGKAKGGKGDRQDDRWDDSRNNRRTGHDQWDQYEKWDDWRSQNHELPPELASHKHFQLMHKITFQEEIDRNFPLAARLIGRGGRNVKHIHKETGAWVWLCGRGSGFKEKDGQEADEPLHIRVQCDSQANLDEAVVQTHDLLDAVLQMYSDWLVSGKLPDEDEACYECGQTGHIAKFCSKRSGNGGRAPRAPREAPNTAFKGASKGEKEKCYDCGEVGHFQRHCPYRQEHQKSQKGNRSWEQKSDWSKSKW